MEKTRSIAVYRASRTALGLVDPVSALHWVQHTPWPCSEAPVPVITRTSYREMNRGFCAILLLGIIIQETRV